MKINYKNTALGLLDKMDQYQFRLISDGDQTTRAEKTNLGLSIVRIWPNISTRFKRKIQYISEPFYSAFEKGAHKLISVLDAEPIDAAGTFIFKASGRETNTIFYSIVTSGKNESFEMDATVLIFNNDTHKDKPALGIVAQRRPGMPAGSGRLYVSTPAQKAGTTVTSVLADIFTLVLFLKYCEVETKIIPAGKKGNHVGTKYVNESRQNIQILDSTWFTTIVKSEGFTVGAETGGFFKLQPYGPNNSQRKLIWVLPYEKEGYTRKAKVLMQNENNGTK